MSHHPTSIELHLFVPPADGAYTSLLQEDDGVSTAASSGGYLRTVLTLDRAGDIVTVTGTVSGNGYPEFARTAFTVVVHGEQPSSVISDGERLERLGRGWRLANDGSEFRVTLRFR